MPSQASDSPNPSKASLQDRLAKLTPAQRRLLEQRLAGRPAPSAGAAEPAERSGTADKIAIVGMACRFPGAENIDAYWNVIDSGIDCIREVPPSRWDADALYDPTGAEPGKMSVRRGGFVDNVDQFDAHFFGIAPREATRMDPQQRLLLEVTWEALESAGVAPRDVAGSNTGVFIGIGGTDYSKIPSQFPDYYEYIDAHVGTGNALSVAAGRISYIFDFQGPSYIVDTACSSALVALHAAVSSIRNGECDAAIAGGVNLILSPEVTIAFSKARMLSPDGVCRPFDAAANGYVRGEGCGLVYLKRLDAAVADGDEILGVIRGTAINQDGKTSGITAPSSAAQRRCIRAAMKQAGISTSDISYIEAHGTATPLGDPIEFQSLSSIFAKKADSEADIYVTSVKANIGHTETVSGMAGLLKVLLMLKHQRIPGQLNLEQLNPNIRLDGTRLRIPREAVAWPMQDRPRIAGISSFGFGGTNSHVIVEEPPRREAVKPADDTDTGGALTVVPVSARSEKTLANIAGQLAVHLSEHPEVTLPQAAWTLAHGREHFPYRAAILAGDRAQLLDRLKALAAERPTEGIVTATVHGGRVPDVGFVFTGQGSQYAGMGRQLYDRFDVFRKTMDAAAAVLDPILPDPLLEVLFAEGDSPQINQTGWSQPAIVAIQCALVELWKSFGVEPQIVAGHSVGEYSAAYAAGVMDLETTLRLIAERGRLMQSLAAGGAMAAVLADPERTSELLRGVRGSIAIAAYNGPENTVVSGDKEAVEAVVAKAEAAGLVAKPLVVSHAFHSDRMDPILEDFRTAARRLNYQRPQIPLISNLTGRPHEGAPDADYWTDHLRGAVRFTDCASEVLAAASVVIELGPTPQLNGMLRRVADANGSEPIPLIASLRRGRSEEQTLCTAVGEAFTAGCLLRWQHVLPAGRQPIAALPSYPFERTRYWMESAEASSVRSGGAASVHPLLGSPVETAFEGKLFEAALRADRPALLADHVVQESVVVPAAALMEMGLAAGKQLLETSELELRDFVIQKPLFLGETSRHVQTIVRTESGNRASFQIFSHDGGSEKWNLHARGIVATRGQSQRSTPETTLEQARTIEAAAIDIQPMDSFYEIVDARGLSYGETFRILKNVYRTDSEATSELQLPEAVQQLSGKFLLHPAVLDGCMQMMAAVTPTTPDGNYSPHTYMPVSTGRLVLFDPEAVPHRIVARRMAPAEPTIDADQVEGECLLLDVDGNPIAELHGVVVQRAGGRAGKGTRGCDQMAYEVGWEVANRSDAADVKGGSWLLVGQGDEALAEIALALRASGQNVAVAESNVAAIEQLAAAESPLSIVWVQPAGAGEDVAQSTRDACHRFLDLLQAAVRHGERVQQLCVVTFGSQPATGPADDPRGGALWGMGRVAQLEHPELNVRLVDSPALFDAATGREVAAELLHGQDEDQVALRRGERFVPRLRLAPGLLAADAAKDRRGPLKLPAGGIFRIRLDGSNSVDGLYAEPTQRTAPGAGEVEIEIHATGLNFSDVLKAMGLYPGVTDAVVPLGIECAGRVTAVGNGVDRFHIGQRVMGVVPYGFASHAVTREYAVAPCPDAITFEEAATIPITYLTAHYGLVRLADLQAGEHVLIHAGAGGVGLAAIAIAQSVGATIYATAGSDGKRNFLRELGVDHVFDSRSLDFADQILELTDGRGVDVVLNSLPGEAIEKSLSILAAYGRFLEIGKTDIYQNRMLGLAPFQDNLSYHAIDLDRVLRQRSSLVRTLYDEVLQKLESGQYEPLPATLFHARDVRDAFRFMAQRKNIGKIVVAIQDDTAAFDAAQADHGTTLITGGLGAIGMELAAWTATRGCRHIALLGRREPDEAAQGRIARLEEMGLRIVALQGDVSDRESLHQALTQLPADMPPIDAVYHAAGALADNVIYDMTDEQLDRALAAKVAGSMNLHEAFLERNLREFVMFSSIACLLGSPGQANYAAGNAFLDTLASYRRGRGLAATSINWGPWASAGMAADADRGKNLAARGLTPIAQSTALDALGRTLDGGVPAVAVLDADWAAMTGGRPAEALPSLMRSIVALAEAEGGSAAEGVDHALRAELLACAGEQRVGKLREYFARQLAAIMGLDLDRIDPQQSLGSMGLDSLMAIELKNTIESRLQVVLPMARFMEGPSLHELAVQVADMLGEDQQVAMVGKGDAAVDTAADSHGLSQGQRALWFLYKLAPESTAYNISDAVNVHGWLDKAVLQEAVNVVCNAHESFRTSFPDVDGRPIAKVAPKVDVPIDWIDATQWSETQVRETVSRFAHEPFDLAQGPLIRIAALRRGDDSHVLVFSVHHIIADFWSLVAVTDQFRKTYTRLREGDEPQVHAKPHQYRHFVAWQQQMLQTPEGVQQRKYWQQQLAGELPILELPTDRPRPAVQTFRGDLTFRWLDPELTSRLRDLAADHNMTLNALLLAAYELLLHRISGQDDVLVGLPTSGRSRAELTEIVGYFVNPVVVRSRLQHGMALPEYLETIRDVTVAALNNQDYPLPSLVELVQPLRDPSRSTLFQALFVMQKAQVMHEEGLTPFLMGQGGATLSVADLTFESATFDHWTAQFDLSLAASEADGGTSLGLQYNSDLFDRQSAQQLLDRYELILKQFVARPAAALGDIAVCDDAERKLLTEQWASGPPAAEHVPVHRAIEAQVRKTPNEIAVECGDERLTYQQLDDRVNALAAALIDSGAAAGDAIGVCLPRQTDLLAAFLAAWKIGGYYVPLDPRYPAGRLQRILEGTDIRVVITNRELQSRLGERIESVLVESVRTEAGAGAPDVSSSADDLAYVIYTSGSTGIPKGAGVYHRGFSNLVRWYKDALQLSADDAVLVITSHGFDLTQKNFYAPLLVGGRVVLSDTEVFDPEQTGAEIDQHDVTVLNCTPSNLYPLVEHAENQSPQRLGRLRHAILGGESIDYRRLRGWIDQPWARVQLMNSYGPTECSDVVAFHRVQPADAGGIPIGRPIDGVRLYNLNDDLQPVPVGVTGQLYIGGICVGAGYLNDPELTAQRFLKDPFVEGDGRMYATGDLVRWDDSGLLHFVGRADNQVKIRGHRIELGEVEAAIGELEEVRGSIVIVREDSAGRQQLAAYVVANEEVSVDSIVARLKDILPPQSVPSAIVRMDALPLTPHGKVDRRSLPAPEDRDALGSAGYVAPRNDVERMLVSVWAEILGLPKVGIHDNFFTLGGDSLLAIQVVARVSRQNYRMTPAMLFQRQTIAELAPVILPDAGELEQLQSVSADACPLLPGAVRMLSQPQQERDHYNLAVMVSAPSGLDPAAVRRAAEKVFEQYDAFRMVLVDSSSDPRQWHWEVRPQAAENLFEYVDLRDKPQQADQRVREIAQQTQRSLDLRAGRAGRLVFLETGGEHAQLLVVGHHTLFDPTSLRLVCQSLLDHYAGGADGMASVALARWSNLLVDRVRQGGFDDEVEYWRSVAGEHVAPLFEPTAAGTFADRQQLSLSLPLPDLSDLATDPQRWLLPAAILTSIASSSIVVGDHSQLRVDIETTGRDLSVGGLVPAGIVGRLVGVFPCNIPVVETADFRTALAQLVQRLQRVPHDGVAFDLLRLYGEESVQIDLNQGGSASVMFNFLGAVKRSGGGADGEPVTQVSEEIVGVLHAPANVAPYPVEIDAEVDGARLVLRWRFDARRLEPSAAQAWMEKTGDMLRDAELFRRPSAASTQS